MTDENIRLKDIHVGNIDGRYEITEPNSDIIDDIFYKPDQISLDSFDRRRNYFIYGNRGVGKTSVLRWLHHQRLKQERISSVVLFKSDITEQERADISTTVGFKFETTDQKKMVFAQDFKQAWMWFLLHQIGEQIAKNPTVITKTPDRNTFLDLLGLGPNSKIEKVLGWLPKLKNQKFKVSGAVGPVKAQYSADISSDETEIDVPLHDANRQILAALSSMNFEKHIHIFIDELEIFRTTDEQFDRDRRFIRDLIFAVSEINEKLSKNSVPIFVTCAVRTEVLEAIKSLGQEVQRRVYDKGVEIDWRSYTCDLKHPLLDMIRKKLLFSEKQFYDSKFEKTENKGAPEDILLKYFPEQLFRQKLPNFLLDRSFYRPRDLIIRLNIAKKKHPNAKTFSTRVLDMCQSDYSNQLWEEVEYGLRAIYNEEEIIAISKAFNGKNTHFMIDDFKKRLKDGAANYSEVKKLVDNHNASNILDNLYRMGVVGNSYSSGHGKGRQTRNRWVFRGSQELFSDKRMMLHPALWSRFDAIFSKPKTRR